MQAPKHLRREAGTLHAMIALYCKAHHDPQAESLCSDCRGLAAYALERLERCPFGWRKPTCARCPVHCYLPGRREEIRRVMRFAGPRMLLHHPILTMLHLLDGFRKPPRHRQLKS
jgi:hypothetical protein